MYEYQRRLINEATKFGQLSPKEKANLPKECLAEEVVDLGEGISAMGGAQKATVAAGLSVSIYRSLLNRLLKFPGHALVLDITTPTGPSAARGGLTGEGSEIKVVKIADIGKYELMGYKFSSLKPGVKAERSWKDHKGEATILAINESMENEDLIEAVNGLEYKQTETLIAKYKIDKARFRKLSKDLMNKPGTTMVFVERKRKPSPSLPPGFDMPKSDVFLIKNTELKTALTGFNFSEIKPGAMAKMNVDNQEGEATIIAINESVNESRNDDEFLKVKPKPFERPMSPAAERKVMRDVTAMLKSASSFRNTPEGKVAKALRELGWKVGDTVEKQEKDYMIIRKALRTADGYASNAIAWIKYHYPERFPKNESVEDLHEFDSEFKQNAKHNLALSTKLAKKRNADHDSQWGVGFRAYCRAVISGNAINMDPPKEPGLKSGWTDARQMIAMGRRLKEEVENLEESAPVKASKSQIEDFKNKVSAYYTARARKQKNDSLFMSAMYGGNIVAQQIDDWVKETGGDVTKLPSYFLAGSKDRTKFEIRPVNDFVKSVFGNFKLVNTTLVKEEVEDVSEAIPTAASSGFRTGVVDGKTNEIVFHGTKPQAVSAMKKLNGKNLKRYFLASLTPSHKLGGKWPGGTPSWVKAESVQEPVSEGVMKDEIMKFLFAMPKQASDEIAQLSKKMGGLKPNTTTETAVKAILVKHKVKLLKDMEWSLKAVIHFFDDMMEEQVSEAYAPQWAYARQKQHPILGRFYYKSNLFEYRAIVKGTPGSDWALSHGMTHEVFLKPVFGDHRDSRFAIIKATVAQVAVDEGEGGKPTYEKWPITRHTKYEDHPSNPTGYKKYG